MPVYTGGHGNPRAKRFLFVDAGSLEDAIKEFSTRYFSGIELPIKLSALKSGLGEFFDRIFYYDAIHTQRSDETGEVYTARTAAKRELLANLAETDGFDVFEGDVRRQRPERPGQKKVDVAIAVDMLTHTFRETMDESALLTSDLDFEPLLRALAQQGMSVTLYHQKKATRELRRAALARRLLGPRLLWGLLTDEFCRANPVPYRTQTITFMPVGTKLEQWDGECGTDHHALYATGEGFAIVDWQDGPHPYNVTQGRDRMRLILFCEDEFGLKVPDNISRS